MSISLATVLLSWSALSAFSYYGGDVLTILFGRVNTLFLNGSLRWRRVGQAPTAQTWQYALAALAGAMIGTTVGLRWLSQRMTRYTLAAILVAAGIQLVAF